MTEQTMEVIEQVRHLIDTTLDAAGNWRPEVMSQSARRIAHEWAHLIRMLTQLEENK